jgi:hypothetical protein
MRGIVEKAAKSTKLKYNGESKFPEPEKIKKKHC